MKKKRFINEYLSKRNAIKFIKSIKSDKGGLPKIDITTYSTKYSVAIYGNTKDIIYKALDFVKQQKNNELFLIKL